MGPYLYYSIKYNTDYKCYFKAQKLFNFIRPFKSLRRHFRKLLQPLHELKVNALDSKSLPNATMNRIIQKKASIHHLNTYN